MSSADLGLQHFYFTFDSFVGINNKHNSNCHTYDHGLGYM